MRKASRSFFVSVSGRKVIVFGSIMRVSMRICLTPVKSLHASPVENYFATHRRQAASVGLISGRLNLGHDRFINPHLVQVLVKCIVTRCLHPPQVSPCGPLPLGHECAVCLRGGAGLDGGSHPNRSGGAIRDVKPSRFTGLVDPFLLEDGDGALVLVGATKTER